MRSPATSNLRSRRFVIFWIVTLALLLCAYPASPRLAHAQTGAEITVINNTGRDIHSLYLSPASSRAWASDQLGKQVIKKGERFRLHGVPCNKYDIKIVDEDGASCVFVNVPLCEDANEVVLTDNCRRDGD